MNHYKPYPAYKDSGVEWLGEVPVHWTNLRFKWKIARNDGGVWGGDPDGKDDTVVLRSTEQTAEGHWKIDDPAPRKLSHDDKMFALLLSGDLLVTKSSGSSLHIGKTTIVSAEIQDMSCCYSNFMQRVRTRQSFLPKLAWYVMNNEVARRQFDFLSNTTTGLANLNGTMIGQIQICVPQLEEQHSIIVHLDRETARIDGLIGRKTRFIELLREKRQALITRAVTKGLDPNVPMKDSGVEWLGDVPAHWDVTPLKYLATFQSGGTPSKENLQFWDGEIPWASAKDLKKDQLDDTSDHITDLALTSGGATLVPIGTVLVVVRGMILARLFPVVEVLVPMAINQDLKALKAAEILHDRFLAYLLRGFAAESLRRLEEAGHGTKALRMDAWTSMRLTVPPLDEQKKILDSIIATNRRIDTLISTTESSIELLKERRRALITAAVTGQIDLRETA